MPKEVKAENRCLLATRLLLPTYLLQPQLKIPCESTVAAMQSRTHNIKAELHLTIEIICPVNLSCDLPSLSIDIPPFESRDALRNSSDRQELWQINLNLC